MKQNKVNLRLDEAEESTLKQAAQNLSIMKNQKPNISKALREGVRLLAEQDPMKPELFFTNRAALRDFQANIEYGQHQLQIIHDAYFDAVGAPCTMEDMRSWFGQNSSDFLVTKKKVIEEGILLKLYRKQKEKYPGLQLTTDNVVMPDLEELYRACHQLIFIPLIENAEVMYWDCYRIVSAKVELHSEKVEGVKNRWRDYAEGPEEKARLSTIKKVCDIFNEVKLVNPSMLNVPGFITYDSEAGVYCPAPQYIKGYIK